MGHYFLDKQFVEEAVLRIRFILIRIRFMEKTGLVNLKFLMLLYKYAILR